MSGENLNTEDALRIFFDGNEVSGLITYGYWRGTSQPRVGFPLEKWPSGTEYRDHWLVNWQPGDSDWRVLRRDVHVLIWPAVQDWTSIIRDTLQSFASTGALVSWCGIEGHFVDPPSLFDAEQMSGGVWAALTRDGEFLCAAILGQAFQALKDEDLVRLHELVAARSVGDSR
jgi:hypothetical protein